MVTIRKYDDADFFQVSNLIQQVFKKYIQPDTTPYGAVYGSAFHSLSAENLKNIEDRFKSCPIRMVAELNKEIVGTVMGTTEELVRIFVCETYHGKGIGEKLIKSFEEEMKELGVKHYKITAS